MKIDLATVDIERIAIALELLAEHYNRRALQRAREGCLVTRAQILRQFEGESQQNTEVKP